MRTALAFLLAALVAQSVPPAPQMPATFSLAFLGHVIGQERVSVITTGPGRRIASAFSFEDRGTKVELNATLELDGDGLPIRLTSKGKTYRLFSTDVDVVRVGDLVRVRDGATVESFDLRGRPFFPIDTYAPIAFQEQLIQFWLKRGRPAEIVAPPAGTVRIRARKDGISSPGVLRLAIDGVTWGTETAWVQQSSGKLLGVTTWAGNLPFEAVSVGREDQIVPYITQAARDRIADLAATSKALAPERTGTFAVAGARIVDGTDRPVIERGVIIVKNGRIIAVGSTDAVKIPAGTPIVSAAGQTIVPGLWDMHAHASQTDWALPYLAGGVTTIRDMGGENEFLVPFRNAIESGSVLAPRMLLAGLVDAPGPGAFGHLWASTPAEGRAVVRQLKAARIDELKVYTGLTAEVVKAMASEAHALGMMVTGHAARGAREAVENGFDQIAHGNVSGPAGSATATELIAFFKAHDVALDPTSSWNELGGRSARTSIESFLPGVTRLPRALVRQFASMPGSNSEPSAIEARQLQSLQMLNEARAAGIAVVAGTDKGIPGFSLQRDIELLVKGGMTPLQAIQAASIVPARVMKLERDTGTLEVGKRADFVVLDGNPLTDISNIRTANRVCVNGRLHRSASLWRVAGYKQ